MKTLRIHNFGPLRDLEIEVRDFMIFIGPQASGKSTLAKLIELSETAGSLLLKTVQSYPVAGSLKAETLWEMFRQGFLENLMLRFHNAYWKNDSGIQISYNSVYRGAKLGISISFTTGSPEVNLELSGTEKAVEDLIELKRDYDVVKSTQISELNRTTLDIRYLREKENLMKRVADDLFGVSYAALVYIPAGRTRFAEEAWMEEQHLINFLQSHEQTYSASSEKDFYVRQFLAQKKRRADAYRSSSPEYSSQPSEHLQHFDQKTCEILRGKLISATATAPESIEIETGGQLPLTKASSGQQEAAEVLMELRGHMLPESALPAWVMIEEPEAHLYPAAQKAMAEAIALFFNSSRGNKVLITTHSPYILAAIDILIRAAETGRLHREEVLEKLPQIPAEAWVDFDNAAAYLLENGILTPLMDPETKSINATPIDEVSDLLGEEINRLLEIQYIKH